MVLPSDYTFKPSRLVAGRYPPPGADKHADRIRERRGARGITVLDANLLHFPAMAGGFNDMLGAVRSEGKVPGDVRELMILRVAAINNAAFEWIHHEWIGRKEGLTTGQLYIIRDTTTPQPPLRGMLSQLQMIALAFTDASTRHVKVPLEIAQTFKAELAKWIAKENKKEIEEGKEGAKALSEDEAIAKTEDLYVEAAMVVASYNMVSRFLLATDVGGVSDLEVPWPADRQQHNISLPSYQPPSSEESSIHHTIHAISLRNLGPSDESNRGSGGEGETVFVPAPWLVFANSLLTDTRMWGWIIPYFLDGGFAYDEAQNKIPDEGVKKRQRYSILLHSQRGHGASSLPRALSGHLTGVDPRQTTIALLAMDIQNLLLSPEISRVIDGDGSTSTLNPVHSIIGVSQGGAAALAFAAMYGSQPQASNNPIRTTKSIVACDTSARTPSGNKSAWADRVRLVYGASGSSEEIGVTSDADGKGAQYAAKVGMSKLAELTVPRWFPTPSFLGNGGIRVERAAFLRDMVSHTSVDGFIAGAQALGDYDLLSKTTILTSPLFESFVSRVLLLSGSLDGGGKVGQGLRDLKASWAAAVKDEQNHPELDYTEIEGAGHLPMVDEPEKFCQGVGDWLLSV